MEAALARPCLYRSLDDGRSLRRSHQGYSKCGTHMAPKLGRTVAHVKLDISGKVFPSCSLTAGRTTQTLDFRRPSGGLLIQNRYSVRISGLSNAAIIASCGLGVGDDGRYRL